MIVTVRNDKLSCKDFSLNKLKYSKTTKKDFFVMKTIFENVHFEL